MNIILQVIKYVKEYIWVLTLLSILSNVILFSLGRLYEKQKNKQSRQSVDLKSRCIIKEGKLEADNILIQARSFVSTKVVEYAHNGISITSGSVRIVCESAWNEAVNNYKQRIEKSYNDANIIRLEVGLTSIPLDKETLQKDCWRKKEEGLDWLLPKNK